MFTHDVGVDSECVICGMQYAVCSIRYVSSLRLYVLYEGDVMLEKDGGLGLFSNWLVDLLID